MYHYIINKNFSFPYYNILKKKDFVQQIKKFSKIGFISSYRELFIDSNKFLPTFDDGLKDHIYSAEILKRYGGIGIFFIPTSPLKNNTILDVHKTHLILGKIKSSEALNELNKYLEKKKITNFYKSNEILKYKSAYKHQHDQIHKKRFKKIINYYGDVKLRGKILDYLLIKKKLNI